MRRFFLALGVRVEDVARPLPDVSQLVHLPANRRLGEVRLAPTPQVLAQQRDGPFDSLVAEILRAPPEAGDEGRLEVLGPQAGVVAPALVGQSGRVSCPLIAVDPVVDAHATGAEHTGDFGNGAPRSGLQDSEGTAEESGVGGIAQLLFQSASLGVGQSQAAHGNLGSTERTASS
jgi:hypothetical protein